jgi:hypothetical protein
VSAGHGNDAGPRLEDHGRSLAVPGFDRDTERGVEALLAVGNGYLGTPRRPGGGQRRLAPAHPGRRGLRPDAADRGTAPRPGAAPAPLVLPDWAALRIWVDDNERG